VRFTANDAGARLFRFKVPTQTVEQVTQNNARDALIQVNDRARRFSTTRRAAARDEVHAARVEGDKNLQVVIAAAHRREQVLAGDVSNPTS
jgi:hypothetical protein